MKKFFILFLVLFVGTAYADTINLHWKNYDGTSYSNSTCTVDSDLILPATTPTRYGYTFTGWKLGNYVQLEHISSNGTQYIDTGISLSNNISIEARIGSSVKNVVGGLYIVWQNDNVIYFRYPGGSDLSSRTTYTTNTLYDIGFNIDKSFFRVDDTVVSKIHNINNSGHITTGKYDIIASLKIYDNGVLVRDLIPVIDMNGTTCMYDKVTEQFFYNKGTGNFIAGSVLQ